MISGLAGSVAGLIVPIVSTPIELVKVQLQVTSSKMKYSGPIHVARDLLETYGLSTGVGFELMKLFLKKTAVGDEW